MSYTRLYQWLLGDRVPQGPFQGMRYIRACVGSALWPKLLGTYEQELNPAVEELIRWQPDIIINAGAAEGYYAVGLALRCPEAVIAAYEMSVEGRKLVNLLAVKNGIGDQLQLAGELTTAIMQERLAQAVRPAVILDVEGAELELLDFQKCPALAKSFVLLENHDLASGSTLPEMRRRFEATHQMEEIAVAPRTRAHLPKVLRAMAGVGLQDRLVGLLDEGRGEAPPWLRLKPRV
ncbi:MAG: hypothetical protein ACO1QS_20110 [Verrucomicrobiota bacterium]